MKKLRHSSLFSSSFFYALLAIGPLLSCATKRHKVCSDLVINDRRIRFNDSEKKLLCGDKKNPSWNEIPRAQVIYHLKTFLLERGYFEPQIIDEPTLLQVNAGPRSEIKSLEISNWPLDVPSFPKKRFIKRALNPGTLSRLEAEMLSHFKAAGYPCAKVEVKAVAAEGKVLAAFNSGEKYRFGKVQRADIKELDPLTLKRFEAFSEDAEYDYKLVELTERRIRSTGLVQDAIYLPQCEKQDFHLEQKAFIGKSRLISLGAGFDSEQYAITKARLNFSRLSSKGSNFDSQAFASLKLQSLTNLAQFNVWPPESGKYIFSGIDFKREDEKHYEIILGKVHAGVGTSFDQKSWRWDLRAGPAFERLWLFRGVGLKNTKTLGLEGNASLTTHLFEYYQGNPQSGSRVSFDFKTSHREVGSTFSALRFKLLFEQLKPVWEDHRSDLIVGVRSFVATTVEPNGREERGRIPPSYRLFLGGSQDLRGFSRLELPKPGTGAFSTAYLGAELRLARIFKVEPLLFFDVGALGNDSFDLEAPYFYSPGFGARYKSPFGTLRASLARGDTFGGGLQTLKAEHWQFFVSFGQEF